MIKKKAKIILLFLCVFALLGAALAFKARTGSLAFCYNGEVAVDPAIQSINVCPDFIGNARIDGGTPVSYITNYYRTIPGSQLLTFTAAVDCIMFVDCVPLSGRPTVD